MALTFQDIYEEIQDLTGDTSATTLTKFKLRINDTYKQLLKNYNKNTETTKTTVASQQSYELPVSINKISSVKVTVSDIDYPLDQIINEDEWNNVNSQGTAFTADIQTNYYLKDNNVLLYPTPASDNNTITFYHTRTDRDLSVDNYTTSTIDTVPFTTTFTAIVASGAVGATLSSVWALPTGTYQIVFSNGDVRAVTLTNASAVVTWTTGLTAAATATITVNNSVGGSIVTGTATVFTALMVGRFLKITNDGYWYKIHSYIDATHITLEKKYEGTALSGATDAYIIGEVPLLPEKYHYALVYRPCMLYFMGKRDQQGLVNMYKTMYDEIVHNLKPEDEDTTSVIVTNEETELKNPADYSRV